MYFHLNQIQFFKIRENKFIDVFPFTNKNTLILISKFGISVSKMAIIIPVLNLFS